MILRPDVAFDILYVRDTSVIHQSLKERHQLLRQVIKPVAGRLEILVPNGGLNAHRSAGEPCWSLIVHDVDGVDRFFKETIENRDEGIVLKDLGSKWEPSDRSGKWLKLKPEYIRAGSDLDVLIIGGYYGSGRHGGEVAQFLVGLAERSAPNTYPRRFLSFCRVGTGLSDEELNAVVAKLKPYLRKYEYPKKAPPSFYQVTNNSKERPDVWVESPEKSIIVSITSDIRTIRSEVFAAPYSLRFPRIDRVRYDKPWHECLDVQSFVELVHSSNGTMQKATDYAVLQENKPKREKSSRAKKNISVVPSHFIQTDVSGVKGETSLFLNMVFYFVNIPTTHSLDSLHKMVVENGGSFSMNLNNSVTHCIGSENKGIKFQAAKRQGDVIHYSWLSDCCKQKQLIPLHPKYFIFLSETTKKKLEEDFDEFADSYYLDFNVMELKQILSSIEKAENSKAREYYKKKFCPREEWVRFHGCNIYFHLPRQLLKYTNWEVPFELAMRRMKTEIRTGGGSVAETLSHATHLVIVSSPEICLDFDVLLNGFSETERRLLHRRRLHIVKSQWLDDCFEKNQKLLEDRYNLKPQGFQETSSGESDEEHKFTGEEHHSSEIGSKDASSSFKADTKEVATSGNSRAVTLPRSVERKKRGRPRGASNKAGKSVVNLPRRAKPRVGKKPAKISEYESDNSATSDEKKSSEIADNGSKRTRAQFRNRPSEIVENELETLNDGFEASKANPNLSIANFEKEEVPKHSELDKGKAVEQVVTEDSHSGQMFGEINKAGTGPRSSTQQYNHREDTVDPVQAMLLNMIPSLATKKDESANPGPQVVKAREEKRTLDAETEPPVKKKKVSYKDIANALLKDW